jgi:tetratricopeptide (TPR) repeat protein
MPGSREAYEQAMNAGHNAAWDQEWHLAVAAYGRAIREFPMDPEAHIHLGLGLFEIGRLEDALKIYSRASQLAKSRSRWKKAPMCWKRWDGFAKLPSSMPMSPKSIWGSATSTKPSTTGNGRPA